MNITAKFIEWAFAHPALTTLLGITAIGGVTTVGVVLLNNAGMVLGKAAEHGTGFAVNNGNVAFAMNHAPIPFEKHQTISEQTEVQPT